MGGVLSWSGAAQAQLAKSTVNLGLLFRLDASPVLRLWGGIGPLATPGDAFDPSGAAYTGVGTLGPLPVLQQLINGVAERVSFTLSGVSPEAMPLVAEDAQVIAGMRTHLGMVVFDGAHQLLSPVAWLWEGVADTLTPGRQPDGDGGATRTITLSAGSVFTGRRRPQLNYWTDAQQRERSEDDSMCDHVASYGPGTTKRFKPRDD